MNGYEHTEQQQRKVSYQFVIYLKQTKNYTPLNRQQ